MADGAEWIALQSREVFGEAADILADFFHVSECLAAAADPCRPQSARTWLPFGCAPGTRAPSRSGSNAELPKKWCGPWSPLPSPRRYPRMKPPCAPPSATSPAGSNAWTTPRAIERELPIGSGLIESAHKHVPQARLKQAGSAWLPESADAIAQLRVIRANEHWEDFWKNHKAA